MGSISCVFPFLETQWSKEFLCSLILLSSFLFSFGQYIHIDQFGYIPSDQKIAVISNPQIGFNSSDSFSPGNTYHLIRESDDSIVFSDQLQLWNNGSTHSQSGDQAWWFDFTTVQDTGLFYVLDSVNQVTSYPFRIHPEVYNDVLKTAVRMFYYNRCNLEKIAPFAEAGWNDSTTNFEGTEQDGDCRLQSNPVPSTSRDLTGGWFDAGDYNKYINSADGVIHDLLWAYTSQPSVWGDDYNLPESGNGIPDLLDEIKWELDWMLKMQNGNGSVLHKVSNLSFNASSPPSADTEIRRYAPATISATISSCAAFAHAALVYQMYPDSAMQSYGDSLELASIRAWNWLVQNPGTSNYDNAGFVNAAMEDNAYTQNANRGVAGVFLFALTGNTVYRDAFDLAWNDFHLNQWWFAYVFEMELQDAALFYATLPGATPAIKDAIILRYQSSIQNSNGNLPGYLNQSDPYLAYLVDSDYTWGNNRDKSQKGNLFTNMFHFSIDTTSTALYRNIASGYLHYIHGVNPMNLVFLTNMSELGAEKSATTMYHSWFHDGHADWDQVGASTYGPPPGYLTGGCNPGYSPDNAYTGPPITPPENQPLMKSYLDWNTSWPENSWEITEPSITYQSAYIRLLAQFATQARAPKPCNLVSSKENSGANTLRSAIACAGEGDTIFFDQALFQDTVKLTSESLFINKSIVIKSKLQDQIVIDASLLDRMFIIEAGHIVSITGLRFMSGSAENGGWVQNAGDLTVEDCVIHCADSHCLDNQNVVEMIGLTRFETRE